MRFVPWCVAMALVLAASPAALAQKKASRPPQVHMPAPKPPPQVHMPAPKPPPQVRMPAPKPTPAPKPAQSQAQAPKPHAAHPAKLTTAQRRQIAAARAASTAQAGQPPRSARPASVKAPKAMAAGRSTTPSRLVPSSGSLITPTINGLASSPLITQTKNGLAAAPRITPTKNGLASSPLITQTPIPALTGLANAPLITPTAVKTNSLMVQNSSKEVVVVGRGGGSGYRGGSYGYRGGGYGHRGYGRRYGYGSGYRSYARFRRPYQNPNAASQALAMQRLEQLRADLDQVRQSRALPSDALRSQIGDDLLAIAPAKPTAAEAGAIRQLGDDLVVALRGHPGVVPPTSDLVLALNQVVNHRRVAPEAIDASIREGRTALQSWRVSLPRITKVVQDLRAVSGTAALASTAHAP